MGGPASGCAARMRSSWPIRISRSSGRPGAGITGEIVTFATPTTRRCRRPRASARATAQTLLPSSSTRRSSSTARRVRGQGRPRHRRPDVPRRRARAPSRGKQVAFVVELDGMHTIHLGEIGHLLTEEKLGDIGPVDIACVPLGGSLSPTKAAELVAQLDPRIVVPMPLCEDDAGLRRGARQVLPRDGRRARRRSRSCRSRSRACRPRRRPSCSSRAARARPARQAAVEDDAARA